MYVHRKQDMDLLFVKLVSQCGGECMTANVHPVLQLINRHLRTSEEKNACHFIFKRENKLKPCRTWRQSTVKLAKEFITRCDTAKDGFLYDFIRFF